MEFRISKAVIDGKEYPVYYNIVALEKYAKLRGKNLSDVMELLTGEVGVTDLIPLFYYGMVYGAKKTGEKFDLSQDDVEDMIALNPEALDQMTQALTDSMPAAEDLPEIPDQLKGEKKDIAPEGEGLTFVHLERKMLSYGILPKDYLDMTLRECLMKVYVMENKTYHESHERWNIMRTQSTLILNMFSKKRLSPDDVIDLDGKKKAVKPLDINSPELKKVLDRMDKVYQKLYKEGKAK